MTNPGYPGIWSMVNHSRWFCEGISGMKSTFKSEDLWVQLTEGPNRVKTDLPKQEGILSADWSYNSSCASRLLGYPTDFGFAFA